MSVILSFFSPAAEEITQSLDQVKKKKIQNWLKAFQEFSKNSNGNGTDILTSFVLPSAGVFPVFYFGLQRSTITKKLVILPLLSKVHSSVILP